MANNVEHVAVSDESGTSSTETRVSNLLLRILILLHALHDPAAGLLGILLRLVLVLHRLPHLGEVFRDVHALEDSRALLNGLHPGFDLWESTSLHASPFAPVDPSEDTDIGQREFVADNVRGFARRDVVRLPL